MIMNKDTVYFDGTCPLCSKEITLWRKLSADQFEFKDIHQQILPDTKREAMLQLLHIHRADGQWLVGLEANFRMWRSHPIGWASYILSLPGLFHITRYAYNTWARRRYIKRYVCDVCS